MCHADEGKRQKIEGMKLPNQESIRTFIREKEKFKYLEILETHNIKQITMKEKVNKIKKTEEKFLETKL